jgi:excisionase family DNA binding protein
MRPIRRGIAPSERVLVAVQEPVGRVADRLAYRPKELAEMVGLSAKAIYRAIERGELRAARVANGSRLLITVDAAESWLRTTAAEPGTARPDTQPTRAPRRRTLADALTASAQLVLPTDDGGDNRSRWP